MPSRVWHAHCPLLCQPHITGNVRERPLKRERALMKPLPGGPSPWLASPTPGLKVLKLHLSNRPRGGNAPVGTGRGVPVFCRGRLSQLAWMWFAWTDATSFLPSPPLISSWIIMRSGSCAFFNRAKAPELSLVLPGIDRWMRRKWVVWMRFRRFGTLCRGHVDPLQFLAAAVTTLAEDNRSTCKKQGKNQLCARSSVG